MKPALPPFATAKLRGLLTFSFVVTALAVPLSFATSLATALPASAQNAGKVLATVNGQPITEADIKLAEAEIGSDLGSIPDDARRRVLVEYTIENILFALAAKKSKLGAGKDYDDRIRYWRRRALRDQYFETTIRKSIKEEDARKIYAKQIKLIPPKEEVSARHILVKTKAEALDITEKLNRGEDFAALAKANSKDPGSKDRGGSLGYFAKGQMVPAFEKAAFSLKKGEISAPVKSRFGYHIIKLDDRRSTPPPPFASIKDRLLLSMIHRKAQETAEVLRKKAKVEYIDAELKKQIAADKRGSGQGGN